MEKTQEPKLLLFGAIVTEIQKKGKPAHQPLPGNIGKGFPRDFSKIFKKQRNTTSRPWPYRLYWT